jgi:hypothetical protein
MEVVCCGKKKHPTMRFTRQNEFSKRAVLLRVVIIAGWCGPTPTDVLMDTILP